MIVIQIPFKNIKPIEVVVMGGTHPYRLFQMVEKFKVKSWKYGDPFCAPEWAEDVYFVQDNNVIRYSCEGRDFYYGPRDNVQRMRHKPNHIKQVPVNNGFWKIYKKVLKKS